MNFPKKTFVVLLVFCLFSGRALAAESSLEGIFKDTVYGGIIGALVGSAFVLLSDHPGDHLEYIPTGAAVGLLAGAVYGLATSTTVRSFGEVENGKFTLNVPTVKQSASYDRNAFRREVIDSVDIFKVKF